MQMQTAEMSVWDLDRNDIEACIRYMDLVGTLTSEDVMVMLRLQDDPSELIALMKERESDDGNDDSADDELDDLALEDEEDVDPEIGDYEEPEDDERADSGDVTREDRTIKRASDGRFGSIAGQHKGKRPAGKPRTPRAAAPKFDATPHRDAIARHKATEAKHRAESLRIKAQMVKIRDGAKGKSKAERTAAKAKLDELRAVRAESQGKANEARAARISASKGMTAARKEHAAGVRAERAKAKATKQPNGNKTPGDAPEPKVQPGSPGGKALSFGEVEAMARDLESKMTPVERSAVDLYISPAYRQINGGLRSGDVASASDPGGGDPLPRYIGSQLPKETVERSIHHLDAVIEKSRLAAPIVTYRGSRQHDALDALKEGQTFTDNAYTSTSSDPKKVLGRDYMFIVTSPAGTKAAALNNGGEGEILLARGTKFRVDKREDQTRVDLYGDTQKYVVFHVTVIGQGEP